MNWTAQSVTRRWRIWRSRCAARRPAAISCSITCTALRRSPACCARATISECGRWAKPDEDEGSLIQRFFDGIEKYTPQVVSWNGSGFDFPVLHYRGLIHGVQCPRYWDMGEDDREFKWNNYISRYHTRHLDLMDLLALYTGRANAPLDEMAKLIGFPGKLGMDGSKVWDAYQQGKLNEIRNYCETDVVNTYLVFARFQLMRGQLTRAQYERECELVRSTLGKSAEAHWKEFLAQWPDKK